MKTIILLLFIYSNNIFCQTITGSKTDWTFYLKHFSLIVSGDLISKYPCYNSQKKETHSISLIKVRKVIKGDKLFEGKLIQIIDNYYLTRENSHSNIPAFFKENSKSSLFFLYPSWNNNDLLAGNKIVDENTIFSTQLKSNENKTENKLLSGKIIAITNHQIGSKRKKKYYQKIYLKIDTTSKKSISTTSNTFYILKETKKFEKDFFPINADSTYNRSYFIDMSYDNKIYKINEEITRDIVYSGLQIGLLPNDEFCKICLNAFDKFFNSNMELIEYTKTLVAE
jgi:hypothetical protein